MHPRNISIANYTYDLPEERIARFPLPERDGSKLLVCKQGAPFSEHRYAGIADALPAGAMLLFNNTRVVAARLLFAKPTGGQIEVFCLEPGADYPDITTAMSRQQQVIWNCLVGGAGKWKQGMVLEKPLEYKGIRFVLKASVAGRGDSYFRILFEWDAPFSFAEVIQVAGMIPLPPYLKRKPAAEDIERYQTVYAKHEGSVAAPTAGLHFTEAVFASLAAKGFRTGFITLHVGAGTFQPVKASVMEEHTMHTEHMEVTEELLETMLAHTGDFICVGTTTLRTVESLYWMGAKLIRDKDIPPERLALCQWEVYDDSFPEVTTAEALWALLQWMRSLGLEKLYTQTQILIAPGYAFKVARGLVTNFHQPGSTLLLLVAALVGDNWRAIYDYALQHEFRFLSYGDGCLLFAQ